MESLQKYACLSHFTLAWISGFRRGTIEIDKNIIFRDVTPCNLVEICHLLIGCDVMYVKTYQITEGRNSV
jgi:hypothetical protein